MMEQNQTSPAPAPQADVTPPPRPAPADPPAEPAVGNTAEASPATHSKAGDKPKEAGNGAKDNKPAPPKAVQDKPEHAPHVTAAIIATVVIVLGIAMLAVYAYLQQVK